MNPLAALDALHFVRPAWLWALVLLPVGAWACWRRLALRDAWRGVVDAHLLPHLLQAEPRARLRRGGPVLLACTAATLAVLALAGPSWQRSAQPLWQARMPLVIALDLSGSTLAADLPPSRLAQARAALETLLARHADGDVGMLVYAEEAFVVAPITSDARNVALFLDALSPGIMPGQRDGPSRADRAITMASDLLRQAGYRQGEILLLEDAADEAAERAARAASAAGYRVSVLGLGTPAGAMWRDSDGGIQRAALDAGSLRALVAAGGGAYAGLAGNTPLRALESLPSRNGQRGAAAGGRARAWQDQGYWLLLPLMLLVAFAFRRGGAFAVLLACAILPASPVQATDLADLWQRADQQAHARLEAGAAAYRQGDFDGALRAWQGVAGAEAAYNRGNALARQGRLAEAVEAYDRALQLQPGMEDAVVNRQAVLEALQQQARETGEGDAGAQQQPGETPGSSTTDPSQADADAAQRQRMQQALQPGEPASDGEQGQAAQAAESRETGRDLERRLADEALLRRIPDDPGGLLRARFLLEYQRRQEQGR